MTITLLWKESLLLNDKWIKTLKDMPMSANTWFCHMPVSHGF